ncbi:hypothetical protein Sa4125_05810 [Aureimonas sp. SA4125]|uniref:TY-Chap domain-containing protein n=1 Tax=Aureimonas sp. SA4125 TaxID=2826993 RepID=UPI001CC76E83|nr:hypothetical protein [Aureimonas sp. SA4125]BDA83039.1 hypothetical protein Sa4125_05810 [Aureimonas sp. SA4125]
MFFRLSDERLARVWLVRLLIVLLAFLPPAGLSSPFSGTATAAEKPVLSRRIEAALTEVGSTLRPGHAGYATIFYGNAYVQCRRLGAGELGCEAAGSAMQPSLARVLTPERRSELAARGWTVDPSFGNYVHTFERSAPIAWIAAEILGVLKASYAAEPWRIEISTEWVAETPCPPRNGFSQNLAGRVSEAMSMQATAVVECSFTPPPPSPSLATSASDLVATYGAEVAAEIRRLRSSRDGEVFAAFCAGIGYVQCQPESPDALYCEAQSEESWPALIALLTPDRIARLHAAGYANPGYSANYSRSYPSNTFDDNQVAAAILTVLHESYNYTGVPELEIATDQ